MRLSAQLGIPHLAKWSLGARSAKPEEDPKGHESIQDSGPFSFLTQHWETSRDEVRTMTVLFSELLVPGWANTGTKIGLGAVTGAYGSATAFTLPCHIADPELFFSDSMPEIEVAKSLCRQCPVSRQCIEAAISREEPCGVWGGELFEDGRVVTRKRSVGRPRLTPIVAEVVAEVVVAEVALQNAKDEQSNAA